MTHYWAVVPAAGSGRRFGGPTPKQYLMLHGQPVMLHSIDRLCRFLPLSACVVAISDGDEQAAQLPYAHPDKVRFVTGGAERMDSVLAGLRALHAEADAQDWVLVHDVARPCITQHSLSTLKQTLMDDPVGGLLAVPVRDTLKRGLNGQVEHTVPREHLWQCQTPQMFRYGLLLAALEDAVAQQRLVTDEASAMELTGHTVRLVEGRSDNIKITYADDLALASAILAAEQGHCK